MRDEEEIILARRSLEKDHTISALLYESKGEGQGEKLTERYHRILRKVRQDVGLERVRGLRKVLDKT